MFLPNSLKKSYGTAIPYSAGPCENGGNCKNSADFSIHTCACSSGFYGTNCETAYTPPDGLGDVINALTTIGVDNSHKQLSITLVWNTDCDLDLLAEQPDGTEISYANLGPHPSTGRMDNDTEKVGPDGLAVENISWITAPSGNYQILVNNYGNCTPGMNYKLYVQIDGQYIVYEKVAPALGVKELVVSFNNPFQSVR